VVYVKAKLPAGFWEIEGSKRQLVVSFARDRSRLSTCRAKHKGTKCQFWSHKQYTGLHTAG